MRLTVDGPRFESPAPPDLDQIRRAVAILLDPTLPHELRGLPSGRSRLVRVSDLDGTCAAAADLADGKGVYYTLNPVRADLGDAAARNADIQARRWLLIDVDPAKAAVMGPAGDFIEVSATDLEKAEAERVASVVLDALSARGWPAPVVVDSGNGAHLLYRVDLPNDDLARQLVAGSLKALAAEFQHAGGPAIDKSVHNAARIAKLPGTWARKGPGDHPDRPWRMCRLVYVPLELHPVPVELLQALAGLGAAEPAPSPPVAPPAIPRPSWRVPTPANGSPSAYVAAAVDREAAAMALTPPGRRHNQLINASLKLAGYLHTGCATAPELMGLLLAAARAAGLPEPEARAAIAWGLDKGQENPTDVRARVRAGRGAGGAAGRYATTPPAGTLPDPSIPVIVRASAITPRRVEWLWPDRLPLGKLSTFAGWGGLGKTFVLLDIAARVSRGDTWPDSHGECAEPGQVLFISGEDDPDDTLVPRLIELGADLDRIAFFTTEVADRFTLADLPLLDRAIAEIGLNVRYVAIDPPTAYLGGVDDHKNAEIRALLSPLKSWASRHRVALIFNTHVNKGTGIEAVSRVMGSVAWVNAVRAAHLFARDPEDHERVLFVPLKSNLGRARKGLAYRIAATETLARVEWLGEVEATADQVAAGERGKPRRVVATEWLIERFRERPEWPSSDLFDRAKHDGLSRNAIFEAKDALHLPRARQVTHANGDKVFVWWVPADWPQLVKALPMANAARVDDMGPTF